MPEWRPWRDVLSNVIDASRKGILLRSAATVPTAANAATDAASRDTSPRTARHLWVLSN